MPISRTSSMKSAGSVESYERSPSVGWGRVRIHEKAQAAALDNIGRVSSAGNLSVGSNRSNRSSGGEKSPMLGGYRRSSLSRSELSRSAGEMSPMLRRQQDGRYSYGTTHSGTSPDDNMPPLILPPANAAWASAKGANGANGMGLPSPPSSLPSSPGRPSPIGIAKSESSAEETDKHLEEFTPPPLVQWIFPALCCALSYALYNIFIKMGSANIHPVLGGVILQFVAAILGTVLILVLIWREGTSELFFDKSGIKFASLAGVMVGLAEIVSFVVSGMGVQAVQSIPIIIGGCIMFGSVLGVVMLKEELTPQGWLGVSLLVAGISLVATDPGAKVEVG